MMELKLDFDDVLMVPQRSVLESRKDVELVRNFKFYHSPRQWTGVPVVCSNMAGIASGDMARALAQEKMVTALPKYKNAEEMSEIINSTGADYSWVSIGKKDEEIDKLRSISDAILCHPNIVIDVPNGYMQSFVEFCHKVRQEFPEAIICAGNVTTPEMVQELIIHGGIDICKLQIGPGRLCRTRMMTGVGYGTFSCVKECAETAHGLMVDDGRLGLVMSDGGCKYPGDVCKVFGGGSDFCMLGSYFAGADECDGDWTLDDDGNKKSLMVYGMSTHLAQEKHGEGKKNYRASEGTVLQVPYKGPVQKLLQELTGGMKSSCSYIGSTKLRNMSKCAKFIQVNNIHQSFFDQSNRAGL